jgi:WD40 repeat protein
VRVWEMKTGQLVATLDGHSASITDVSISSDGRTITSQDWTGTTLTWSAGLNFPADESSLPDTLAYPLDQQPIACFEVQQSGWLVANAKRLCWLPVDRRPSRDDALAWWGFKIVTGSRNGTVTILDAAPQLAYYVSL